MRRTTLYFIIALLRCVWLPAVASAQQGSSQRQLPPSMRIELAKEAGGKHKAIIYRDTLKSAQIQSALLRDTSNISDSLLESVKDSALATVDSSAAEPTLAHLDSAIAELPEFSRANNKAHFEYPGSIMTESYRNAVPFDSAVLERMNPISRENLPYFDQHPMPLPLKADGGSEGSLSLGAGNLRLPYIHAGYSRTLNDRWEMDLQGKLIRNIGSDPVELYWKGAASVNAELGRDPSPNRNTNFALNFATTGKQLALYRDSGGTSSQVNHTVALESLTASFLGQWADHSTYSIASGFHVLSDNISIGSGETSEWFQGKTTIGFGRSDFGMQVSAQINHASGEVVQLPSPLSTPAATDLLAQNYSLRITNRGSSGIVWTAGLNLFAGSDMSGTGTVHVLPSGSIKFQITPDWSVGVSFDPSAKMLDLQSLLERSPFFTASTAMQGLVADSGNSKSNGWLQAAADPRRVSIDQFDLVGFTSYALSADDEVHAEVEIADRNNDVEFFGHALGGGKFAFYGLPEQTRRFKIGAGSNLLFFTSDILTVNFEYNRISAESIGAGLPFEPTLKFHVAYRLNGLSDLLKPSLGFDQVNIPGRSFSFMNLGCDVILGPKFAILLRCENLFGSSSDYWGGYSELPRSIWAALNFEF